MHCWSRAVSLVGLFLLASTAGAQFAQYTPPGGGAAPSASPRESLEKAVADARWRLGSLRLDPWIGVRNLSYVDNVFATAENPVSDVSATAGAGLRAYLPTGPKVTVAAHVLPEYVWWRDQSERRVLTGRYGVGLFGFWNRLSLQATANREEQQAVVSSELAQRVDIRQDRAALATEVVLQGSLALFADLSESRFRFPHEGDDPRLPPVGLLARTERLARGGLAFRTRGGWRIGLGAEHSTADFRDATADRSNSGTAPVLELAIPGRGFSLSADVARRSLTPRRGAATVEFHGTTGSARLSLGTNGRIIPALYASRNLVYSPSDSYAYATDDRAGVSLTSKLGWRTSLELYAETGRDVYQRLTAGIAARRDDYSAYGAGVELELRRSLAFHFAASRSDYRSTLSGFDRTVSSLEAGFTLGAGPSPWY